MPCGHLLGKFVMSDCEVVTLGQVWCLIVSIPDLCPLAYFKAIIYESPNLHLVSVLTYFKL